MEFFIAACFKKIIDLQQYVDILINNAGVLVDKDVDKNIDVNFVSDFAVKNTKNYTKNGEYSELQKAVVKGTVTAIECMWKGKGGKGGAVVNVSSFAGLINNSVAPVYNAS